jgi:2-polyprenyl-6-methoxyphenol hydroxylase-like FAD-dependent oxidoreductase
MLLARRGLSVLAIDRGRHGADTLSTHALMRGGVLQLKRWGVLSALKAARTPPVHTTSFHYGDDVVAIPITERHGVDRLYAPRRTVIDRLLVDAAREAGAEVAFGARLVDLERAPDDRICGALVKLADGRTSRVEAGVVIGADGARSTVAGLVGAKTYRTARHTTSVLFSYWEGTGFDGYHWYFRPGVSAGSIETNDGAACVFAAMPPRRFQQQARHNVEEGHRQVLSECDPRLTAAIDRGRQVGKLRGFRGMPGFFRQSWGPGWALVGDAGYFKDPITAHGMTDALIDAEVLARAVTEGGDSALADYQRARDARALSLFEITDAVASFDWDLERVTALHRSLSDSMKHETAQVAAFG